MILRRLLSPSLVLVVALAGCDSGPSNTATTPKPAAGMVKAAEKPPTHIDDVAAAQRQAEAEEKPLLLFFTAEWCSFCRQMRNETFRRPEFADAAQRFVVVEVDGASHAELCAKYRVAAYPTLVLAAPDGTALDRIVGMSDAAAIIVKMNAALTTFVALRPEAAQPGTATVR